MIDTSLISAARLDTYRKFSKDDAKALELHNMTMQVGSSLMAVIAIMELCLRNRIDAQIAKDFGSDTWLVALPPDLKLHKKEENSIKRARQHAQQAQYAKLSYKGKIALDDKIYPRGVPANIKYENLSRKRWETFDVNQGQLIAQTTIFFWKRLFSSEYNEVLWRRSLRKIFPEKHIKRVEVSEHLEALYSARNRIAHHDPVFGDRLEKAIAAVRFLREHFDARKDGETEFRKITEIQYHRLYIDYIAFKNSWALLED